MIGSTPDGIQPSTVASRNKWFVLAHYLWFVCVMAVVIILLGALPTYYTHYAQAVRSDPFSLGSFKLPFQALVQISNLTNSFISIALAILLYWRKPNDRMALYASFFFLITAVVWSYPLDYFLAAYFGMPSTYEIWATVSIPLTILLPCIFPDGRFVPRWTRWVFLVSIPASLSIFAGGEWFSIANDLTYPLFFLVMYAQVYRYRRVSSYAERQQTKWVVFSFVVSMALSVIASLIYKKPSAPLINILPLALTIAILRSHLWDIDILIRRTLQYSMLTGLLSLIYFSGVVILQAVFRAPTGETNFPLITIFSTLLIAALFNPLRRRIQDFLDGRFFRKKYNSQQVLAHFAQTARDETDMEALTAELVRAVQETLQPETVALWFKRASGRGSNE